MWTLTRVQVAPWLSESQTLDSNEEMTLLGPPVCIKLDAGLSQAVKIRFAVQVSHAPVHTHVCDHLLLTVLQRATGEQLQVAAAWF